MKLAFALVLATAGELHAEPDAIELTWLVAPDLPAKPNQLPATPVSLVVTIGGVDRVVKLAPQVGQLRPYYQPVCAGRSKLPSAETPLGHGEVARITFDEGGFGGYIVRRADNDTLEVIAWSLGDGACDDHGKPVACPRKDSVVTKISAPAAATVHEHLVRIDDHGNHHPFACT
jgi:hypothetical protein